MSNTAPSVVNPIPFDTCNAPGPVRPATLDYDIGLAIATVIVQRLEPFCVPGKIVVAGSIRRHRARVGDIDIVLMPKPGQEAALRARILEKCVQVSEGEHSLIANLFLPPSAGMPRAESCVQLDVWFTRPAVTDLAGTIPGNWGTVLLCRTGSMAHNIHICECAERVGLHWSPCIGLTRILNPKEVERGVPARYEIVASETEEAIFTALGIDFVPPEKRER